MDRSISVPRFREPESGAMKNISAYDGRIFCRLEKIPRGALWFLLFLAIILLQRSNKGWYELGIQTISVDPDVDWMVILKWLLKK
jgi:hypothetical protein